MRVLSVFGTRPEAIKMAPVLRRLAEDPAVDSSVCVTAQHREMLDQVLEVFDLRPDHDLNLMRQNQKPQETAAAILGRLGPLLDELRPQWVLVQGDTATTMAASLAAHYHRIRVGHVEAGLRTGDKWQPFPEEMQRRVTGVVADLHFAPTDRAAGNLLREGVASDSIVVTGNTVVDALQLASARPAPPAVLALLRRLGIPEEPGCGSSPRLILVTAHRRENLGRPLEQICAAVAEIAATWPQEVRLLYSVHPNPRVQDPVHRLLGGVPNIFLLPPQDYLSWVHLLKRAWLLLTDSGGLQEEAPALGVPVLVLRWTTERPEGVEAGTARLVGTERENIVSATRRLLEDEVAHGTMARALNPYGDGRAAERIVAALLAREAEGRA